MAIELPAGDLARVKSIEPDQTWPLLVQVVVAWKLPGGTIVHRTRTVLADEYFGRGVYGAPMSGQALAATVEHMRREGPPKMGPKSKTSPRAAPVAAKALRGKKGKR